LFRGFEEGWKRFRGGAEDDLVKGFGVEGLFGADVEGADVALAGDVNEAGGGVYGARCSHDEQNGSAVEFAIDGFEIEGNLAEPDDVGANRGSAVLTSGQGGSFVDGIVLECDLAASASGLKEGSVHVVNAVGAGALVEVIDVLGAEIEAIAQPLFYFGKAEVSGVGFGPEGVATAHGVETPDEFRVGLPRLGSRDLFDTVAVPQSSGAAKGSEAALGGDARSGENEEAI